MNAATKEPSAATFPDSGATRRDERTAYRANGGQPPPESDTEPVVLPQLTLSVGAYTATCPVAVCTPSFAVTRYEPTAVVTGTIHANAKSPAASAVTCTNGRPSSQEIVMRAVDHP